MHHNPVDFSDLVDSACLEYDAIAFEHGTYIEEEVDEGIVVSGDTEWLERLVKILIENACKYTKGTTPVLVSLADEGKRCTLSVNNTGDVIDAQDLPHVFDRFYRTDKARTRGDEAGGFGLGLAIAKGIAESHKGTIDCTSNEVEGTTFTVTLPQAAR
jgi:signal transduction histidine kinase